MAFPTRLKAVPEAQIEGTLLPCTGRLAATAFPTRLKAVPEAEIEGTLLPCTGRLAAMAFPTCSKAVPEAQIEGRKPRLKARCYPAPAAWRPRPSRHCSKAVPEAQIEGSIAAAAVAGVAHRVAGAVLVVDLGVGRIEIAAF